MFTPNKPHQTALLLFAQTDRQESVCKPLFGKTALKRNQAFYRTLNQWSHRVAKQTGLPLFHISETAQTGATFGERFINALQQVFDQGYARVIVIGNDTPGLRTRHIMAVVHALDSSDWVVGPATDGGIYVLGTKQSAFNPEWLAQLPWRTPELFYCFVQKHSIHVLEDRLGDIDQYSDLLRLKCNTALPLGLIRQIEALQAPIPAYNYPAPPVLGYKVGAISMRGPPFV